MDHCPENAYKNGAIVGLVQSVVGFPLDSLKVRTQVASSTKGGFLCGVAFPMTAAMCEMSIVFGVTGTMKKVYDLPWYLCGGLSGLGSAIPNHILDAFKIRSQLGEPCLGTITSPPWYRGLHWTFCREVPAFSVYFGSYYWMKDNLSIHPFFSGGLAGWLSWLVTYPQDAFKTRVQAGYAFDPSWLNKTIWKGFGAASARALLVNGVGFYTYEMLKEDDGRGAIMGL